MTNNGRFALLPVNRIVVINRLAKRLGRKARRGQDHTAEAVWRYCSNPLPLALGGTTLGPPQTAEALLPRDAGEDRVRVGGRIAGVAPGKSQLASEAHLNLLAFAINSTPTPIFHFFRRGTQSVRARGRSTEPCLSFVPPSFIRFGDAAKRRYHPARGLWLRAGLSRRPGLMTSRRERLAAERDMDVLLLRAGHQLAQALLAADARLLDAAERRAEEVGSDLVDPDIPRLHFGGGAVRGRGGRW